VAAWNGFTDIVIVLLAASASAVSLLGPIQRVALHWAAAGLASSAAAPNADSSPDTAAAAAAAPDDDSSTRCVRVLIKASADGAAAARDAHGATALWLAAERGSVGSCRLLIGANVPVDGVDESGATPLHIAAANSRDDVVRLLLRSIDDLAKSLTAKDKSGATPLHCAARGGSALCVELLLASGASVAALDLRGLTPLHECTSRQSASLLIKAGAELESTTAQGRTPLHVAAVEGRVRIVKYLLEKSTAGIDHRDDDGATALHSAAFRGHLDCVTALAGAGAKLDQVDNTSLTPLHAAAFRGHLDVVKKLLSAGANANVTDAAGTLPLHGAAAGGHDKVVKVLLKADASSANSATNEGGTALHFAAASSHVKIVTMLLDAGAKVDAVDVRRRTALQFAAHQDCADVCKVLLERGARVAAADVDGNNALHVACLSGARAAIAAIVEAVPAADLKAAASATNAAKKTPTQVAAAEKQSECVDLLSSALASDDDDDESDDGVALPPPPLPDEPVAHKAPPPVAGVPTDKAKKKRSKKHESSSSSKPQSRAPEPATVPSTTKGSKSGAASSTSAAPAAVAAAPSPSIDSKLPLLTSCVQGAKLVPLHRLAKMLLEPDRKLVKVLFKTTQLADADKLARGLMSLHERCGESVPLLQCAIEYEVAANETAGTVFRANTLQSKLLTQYATLHGNAYLREVLLGPIEGVLKRAQALEIDPTRVELPAKLAASGDTKAQDAERARVVSENTKALVATLRVFLDALFGSAARVPEPLRFVCGELSTRVRAKFGEEHVPIIVGGFLFLRFITPAVVTPESNGQLVASAAVTREARRTLLLLSKVLTQLANGVPKFGVREEFMAPLNATLGSELGNMRTFLGRVSSGSARGGAALESAKVSDAQVVEGWNLFHERLTYDRQRIEQALDADTNKTLATVFAVLPKPPALIGDDIKS
jgi:ankyrin repeat protein